MVRKLILIIMIVLFIGVPCGTHAAVELDADDNGAVDLNKGGTNSQTGGMVATTPVTAPSFISDFIDGFAGIFWDDPNTIIPTETYGIYPYAGRMYKIENSVHSLMDAGGGSSVVEVADTPEGWEMIPGTLYIAQDDGELSFLLADSSEVFRYAATANTLLYPINLTVVSGTTSTVDINGTSYPDGGPYAISALIGATTMGITYDTEDTTVWSGTDAGDVTGTTPTYSITVDAAKTITATISAASSGVLYLYPDATGYVQQWASINAVDHNLEVDDPRLAIDGDATYIHVSASSQFDGFNFQDDTGDVLLGETITNVRVYFTARTLGTSAMRPSLRVNSTNYSGTQETLTTGYVEYYTDWAINPDTTTTWTQSDINSLIASMESRTTASEMRVTSAYLEVSY